MAFDWLVVALGVTTPMWKCKNSISEQPWLSLPLIILQKTLLGYPEMEQKDAKHIFPFQFEHI